MIFGKAFLEILNKRNMPLPILAERCALGESELTQFMSGKASPSTDEATRIADALGVPVRALFAKSASTLSSIPDFRRSVPAPALMDAGSIKAIAYVEKISLTLAGIGIDLGLSESLGSYNGPFTKDAAKDLAEKWRKRWGLSNEQQMLWRDAHKVYVSFRDFIESFGIFVMHYPFGGDEVSGLYAKIDGGPHTILINTRGSSKARKLFTLAHEFCHVLLRADGFSNSSVAKNKVEVFCNQFAAFILAPDSLIRRTLERYNYSPSLNDDMIRLFARNIGISQQASVLRLMEMGFLSSNSYAQWMARFDGRAPLGDRSDGGGGGGSDPVQNKRTQYGSAFLAKLTHAYKEGFLDPIEIYRLAGIKPKYQSALFGGH